MNSKIINDCMVGDAVTIYIASAMAGTIAVTKTPVTVSKKHNGIVTVVLDNTPAHGREQIVPLSKQTALTREHALMRLYEELTSRELQVEIDLASLRGYKNQISKQLRDE